MARKTRRPAGIVERIEIKGFKSIAEATLDLGLLNVFIGANGSGKSSLFEATAALSAAAAGCIDSVELERRGARLSPIGRYATHLSSAKERSVVSLGAIGRERGISMDPAQA
jgi:predicted ATPase